MTTVSEFTLPILRQSATSLQEIAANLISSFSAAAFQNSTILVNNIPDDLLINADPEIVASILGGALAVVNNHSKESLIAVSANRYDDIVLIHIKDYNGLNGYALDKNLQPIQGVAEKIGGFVNVTSRRQDLTMIAFSFPDPYSE